MKMIPESAYYAKVAGAKIRAARNATAKALDGSIRAVDTDDGWCYIESDGMPDWESAAEAADFAAQAALTPAKAAHWAAVSAACYRRHRAWMAITNDAMAEASRDKERQVREDQRAALNVPVGGGLW